MSRKSNIRCTVVLAVVTGVLSLLVAVKPELFPLFAMWSDPEYPWQYVSGIFIHGIEPIWFLFVHLGLNLLGLIPFGIFIEHTYGMKKWLLLFVSEWAVTALVFQGIHWQEHTYGVGISSIVYAFATVAFPIVWKKIKSSSKKAIAQPLFYYAVFEYLGLLSMLNPLNGVSALCLHLSGIVVGGLFLAVGKIKSRNK